MVTLPQLAKLINVSTRTLYRWHERKWLIPAQILPGGERLYGDEQIEQAKKLAKIPQDLRAEFAK